MRFFERYSDINTVDLIVIFCYQVGNVVFRKDSIEVN